VADNVNWRVVSLKGGTHPLGGTAG